MTGNGKVARLPLFIRNQLNERLQNGEEGKDLVCWLNRLEVVKEILEDKFGGRAISEQNLSEWKHHSHQDWLKREEKRALLRDFLDEAAELEDELGEVPLTDRLTETATLALAQLLRAELANDDKGPKHRAALLDIVRELARLRAGDHEMERVRLQRDRWEVESEQRLDDDRRRDLQEMKARTSGRIWATLRRPLVAKAFGGGESGKQIAEFLDEINYWDPFLESRYGLSTSPPRSRQEQPKDGDQTKSNSIKPNQTAEFDRPGTNGSNTDSIQPNPAKSDQIRP